MGVLGTIPLRVHGAFQRLPLHPFATDVLETRANHGLLPVTKGTESMPLFMDVHHKAPAGAKANDVAAAHQADLATQEKYGVKYINYWFDEKEGKIFCLVDAPNAEAAHKVHKEAHGLVADEINPVVQG
jgi:hypothetical protein